MSGSGLISPSIFRQQSKLYPAASSCTGAKVGYFHGRHWWHAVGPARDVFKSVEADLLEQLTAVFSDSYCSIVHFHLYMIGKSEERATPTIMFFCEEKEPRKKAKKALDDGGLLARLPGFRTGHQARQPGLGSLVLPATGGKQHEKAAGSLPLSVFFDPTSPLKAAGMPIFVQTSSGILRRATANILTDPQQVYYISVFHVFSDIFQAPNDTSLSTDDDFDLGSGTEGEDEDMDMQATSRGSRSPRENDSHSGSEAASPSSGSSNETTHMEASSKLVSEPTTHVGISASEHRLRRRALIDPSLDELEQLGVLHHYSIDQDWATIKITNSDVSASLSRDFDLRHRKIGVPDISRPTKIMAYTSSGLVSGEVKGEPSWMRLPSSVTFQEVYNVLFDDIIHWGDCGISVLDMATHEIYGHVVACSEFGRSAFVMAASHVSSSLSSYGLTLSGACESISNASAVPQRPLPQAMHAVVEINDKRPDATIEPDQSSSGTLHLKRSTTCSRSPSPPVPEGERSLLSNMSAQPGNPRTTEMEFMIKIQKNRKRSPDFRRKAMGAYLNQQKQPSSPVIKTEKLEEVKTPTAPLPLIVQPLPWGRLSHFQLMVVEPLRSLEKLLDPFRTHFLGPQISIEQLKSHFLKYFGSQAMENDWIPAIVASPDTVLSTLCLASAHHDALLERTSQSVYFLALRKELVNLISRSLANQNNKNDQIIITIAHLMISEFISGAFEALNWHQKAILWMVRQRGGLTRLGIHGRLASTLTWISLELAIMEETKPDPMYIDFCSAISSKVYPDRSIIPESPLYRPRYKFHTIERSERCSSILLETLDHTRMMIDLFVQERKHSGASFQIIKNIYLKITSKRGFPRAFDLNVTQQQIWTYEAVRLTTIIQATSILHQKSLSEALEEVEKSRRTSNLLDLDSPFTRKSRSSEYSDHTRISDSADMSRSSEYSDYTRRSDSTEISSVSSNSTGSTFARIPFSSFEEVDFPVSPTFPAAGLSGHNKVLNLTAPGSWDPLASQTGSESVLKSLQTALKNSNIYECWSEMAGVLLWIALTIGAASSQSDNVLTNWFRALAVRVSMYLGFEHPEAVQATVLRMTELMELVGSAAEKSSLKRSIGPGAPATMRHGAYGKRRRV